jgi:hypothetical protein
VDSAHLDLSIDELGKRERELISYYWEVRREKELLCCLCKVLILKCLTKEPSSYRMPCSVSQTAGASFHKPSTQGIQHHRDFKGKGPVGNEPGLRKYVMSRSQNQTSKAYA